jgi:hypothetical protein
MPGRDASSVEEETGEEAAMKKESNETIVKHFYNLPKSELPTTENYRQVSIVTSTKAIHLVSSFKEESILFLSEVALDLLKELKE